MSAKGQQRTWIATAFSVSGGFRKACSSDTPPHQNRLVFRPACSPSRDGSRVEPGCSRRRCKQSVAVQQWQLSCDACGAQAPRWPASTQVQAQRPKQGLRLFSSRSSQDFCNASTSAVRVARHQRPAKGFVPRPHTTSSRFSSPHALMGNTALVMTGHS
jgi:hypothetical protein